MEGQDKNGYVNDIWMSARDVSIGIGMQKKKLNLIEGYKMMEKLKRDNDRVTTSLSKKR